MNRKIEVLFIGESWFAHTMETKGADIFTYDCYEVGTQWIAAALDTQDIHFTHLPCHLVDTQFPETLEALQKYDAVMLSDVGANTFLLPVKTFLRHQPSVNRLSLIRDFVAAGGGFGMIGGYLTFMGMEGKGKYKDTVIEELLPVTLLGRDDRVEIPEGFRPRITPEKHPVLTGIPPEWPLLLGYNRLRARESATVLAEYQGDPIIALGGYGKGRTLAYATDCAPHWSPEAFCQWEGYAPLWQNLVQWLTHQI